MPRTLTRSVAPTVEPVTTDEVRTHLRLDPDPQDETQLSALITAAREHVEAWIEKALLTQTWVLRLDNFPSSCEAIRPDMPPMLGVTSIVYTATDGTSTTLSASLYQTDIYSMPGRIMPAYGQAWPSVQSGTMNAVTVTYTAGYGAAATAVPGPIKQAILMLIGELWENREATLVGTINTELPFSVKALLGPYRTMTCR